LSRLARVFPVTESMKSTVTMPVAVIFLMTGISGLIGSGI
jgi:hypothetical protein